MKHLEFKIRRVVVQEIRVFVDADDSTQGRRLAELKAKKQFPKDGIVEEVMQTVEFLHECDTEGPR